jgi:hypothetical protein
MSAFFALGHNVSIFKKPQLVTIMEALPFGTLRLKRSHSMGLIVGARRIEVARQWEVWDAIAISETNNTRTT